MNCSIVFMTTCASSASGCRPAGRLELGCALQDFKDDRPVRHGQVDEAEDVAVADRERDRRVGDGGVAG